MIKGMNSYNNTKQTIELKQLTLLETLEDIKDILSHNFVKDPYLEQDLDIIETAIKDYEELLKIDCKQNTINDFYPNTKAMIDDLLNLVCTKVSDFLKEGKTYTRTGMLETLGFAIRYVKTFAYGGEFNETEKIGVNAKKLKALEIIKEKQVDVGRFILIINTWFDDDFALHRYNDYLENDLDKWKLTKEEFDLLKEVLK